MSQDHERLLDPGVQDLMSKVALIGVEEFAHQRAARVTISLEGGAETLVRTVRDVRGTPKNPMSFDEVAAKFLACADFADWPREKSERVIELVQELQQMDDLQELTACLRP